MSNNKISEEKLAWVKELLQRKPRIKSPEPDQELNNTIDSLPFDLSEDLYNILQESRSRRKQNMSKNQFNENKENLDVHVTYENIATNVSKIQPNTSKSYEPVLDGNITIQNPRNILNNTANDSFLYLEQICNKTVSDPNNTIHSYVSQMKERNQNSISAVSEQKYSNDDECAAIHRLLSEFDITSNTAAVLRERAEKYERPSLNANDETQLDDVEAPSTLWNTIVEDGESSLPVKRFSTIFEESNFSNDARNFTFRIGSQPSTNETTDLQSTCYETAKEQSTSYETASETAKEQSTSYETADRTIGPIDNGAVDLTVLDESTETNGSESDTIEVLDDSTEEIAPGCESTSEVFDNNFPNIDESIKTNESYTFNVSREFNDTLEEVEYIMKQGAKNMMQNGANPKIVSDIELKIKVPIRKTKSPIPWSKEMDPKHIHHPVHKNLCKPDIRKNSPMSLSSYRLKVNSPICGNMLNSNAKSPSTPYFSNSSERTDFFKKPASGISVKTQQSKKKFANVISPVGAYIKRTPETPLFTNVKSTTVQSLDYREIARRIQYVPVDDKTNQIAQRANVKCGLPKKAYVSSDYYNVKDERKPFVIPGGDKIHRYLKPALLPHVIRHDGKTKVDMPKKNDDNNSTVDSSLADLSVMSGNVSLYTIKHAQDFSSNTPKFVKKFQ